MPIRIIIIVIARKKEHLPEAKDMPQIKARVEKKIDGIFSLIKLIFIPCTSLVSSLFIEIKVFKTLFLGIPLTVKNLYIKRQAFMPNAQLFDVLLRQFHTQQESFFQFACLA